MKKCYYCYSPNDSKLTYVDVGNTRVTFFLCPQCRTKEVIADVVKLYLGERGVIGTITVVWIEGEEV